MPWVNFNNSIDFGGGKSGKFIFDLKKFIVNLIFYGFKLLV